MVITTSVTRSLRNPCLQTATAVAVALLGCGAGYHQHTGRHESHVQIPAEPCSESWAELVGPDAVRDVWTYSVDKRPEFVAWLLAVAWQESHFDPTVKSPAGAVGLLQLTGPGALEAALECDLPKLTGVGQLDELLDRRRSIVYGSCLLRKYLRESGGNMAAALMLYNGGYRQLESYLGRRHLVAETQDYVRDVFFMRYACGPINKRGDKQ